MNNTPLLQEPYLRVQRDFPAEINELSKQVDQAYIDIAQKVNVRTIGIFPVLSPVNTGEGWFIKGNNQKQQSLRRIYLFSGAGNIPHGINQNSISLFTKCQGAFTDGTNWYGAIFASNTAIAGQISFFVTPTNIVILSGAGAPNITQGIIILEWLSLF